jgi:hypothetical protein
LQELKDSKDFSTLADNFYLCDKTGLFRTAATVSKPISKLFVVATQVSHRSNCISEFIRIGA